MLNFKPFQKLSGSQWYWLWSAYWRLWPTLLRIKLRQGAWLETKLSFVDESTQALKSPQPSKKSLSLSTKRPSPPSTKSRLTQMHESVRLAARLHFMRADCLPKSIVLADMLRLLSYDARTIIGVSKSAKQIASHAWVEVDGLMLGEPESVASDFTALQR